jgi:hypothetical protein
MKVRRIVKFEFEGGHDVEFVPSTEPRVFSVWIDGIFLEDLPYGVKPSEARACYYSEVWRPALEKALITEVFA